MREEICAAAPEPVKANWTPSESLITPTKPGDLVLDCVLVEPEQWWVGFHRADGTASRWPGGLFWKPLPADAVSRAYSKMEEALAWSGLPVRPGTCASRSAAPPAARARRF